MNSYFSFSDRPISKFPIATFYVKITQPFHPGKHPPGLSAVSRDFYELSGLDF